MMKENVRIVSDYRELAQNEFVMKQDLFNDNGVRQVFEYLESEFGIKIEKIPSWQVKLLVRGVYNDGYVSPGYGIRITQT